MRRQRAIKHCMFVLVLIGSPMLMAAGESGIEGITERIPCAESLPAPATSACPQGSERNQLLECFAVVVQARVVDLATRCGQGLYPSEALEQEWEGITEVALDFDRDGQLREAVVGASSGHEVLDRRAVALVREALVPVPPLLHGSAFTLRLPIAFRLTRLLPPPPS